jgi:hypothetical protein
MKVFLLNLLLIVSLSHGTLAQDQNLKLDDNNIPLKTGIRLGLGSGIPNGGMFGGQISALINQNIEIFAGIGTNTFDPTANVGLSIILKTKKNYITPKLLGTYGSNSILILEKQNNRTGTNYNGFSAGLLLEIRFKPESQHYLSIGVIYASPSEKLRSDIESYQQDPNYTISKKPAFFLFTMSYHFHIFSF